MWRRTAARLFFGQGMQGKVPQQPNGNPISGSEGVPGYGNCYSGRVDAGDFNPPPGTGNAATASEKLFARGPSNRTDDPVVQAKLDRCPYFALCDMVVWQEMDPQYLDPGVLSDQEHHLLLLHSRAYYEKWRRIHKVPRQYGPHIRVKKGTFDLCNQIFTMLGVEDKVQQRLADMLVDDASLISMHPKLWVTANLDPRLRDTLTGRVLDTAGVKEYQRERIFDMLHCMRKIRIHRRDLEDPRERRKKMERGIIGEDDDDPDTIFIYPYQAVRTLHDLSSRLGLESYSGQVKLYNFYDEHNTRLSLTVNSEDDYFDFLVLNFFKANLRLYGSELLSRYTLSIEPYETCVRGNGRWF